MKRVGNVATNSEEKKRSLFGNEFDLLGKMHYKQTSVFTLNVDTSTASSPRAYFLFGERRRLWIPPYKVEEQLGIVGPVHSTENDQFYLCTTRNLLCSRKSVSFSDSDNSR